MVKETVVDMDNLWGDGEEAARVRAWVNDNAAVKAEVDESKEFRTEQALKAKNLRTGGRLNSDGTVSSVNMVAYEEDGVFKVVPTLFPIDPNIQSTRADRWMDLGENLDEAKEVAANRDEVFTFSSMEEAQAFANGGYKSEDTVNLEMRKIYEDKGYDYDTESKKVDEYRLLRDALAVYEAALHTTVYSCKQVIHTELRLLLRWRKLSLKCSLTADGHRMLLKYTTK